MAKTHFDPVLHSLHLVASVPLHATAYNGGVNGLQASPVVSDVDCRICIRVMLSPEWHPKLTYSELDTLNSFN